MKEAGLVYSSDTEPGISRVRRGRGFSYIAPDGTAICDKSERQRLESIAVPPAYADVWMCSIAHGHLQATGRDDRGRKQYRYHADWTRYRAEAKFGSLVDFGRMLPRIRRRVHADLSEDVGEQEFALAAAVTLIDRASVRVGDPKYTEENGSFGALTLRNRHLKMGPDGIQLRFTAKGGKMVAKQITDKKLARVLGTINDLPGATLLGWVDDDGAPQSLRSDTLNGYIAEAAGDERITAKTFRTWAGTCAAFKIAEAGHASIKDMADAAAKTLHNTPTIARNSYVHPEVIALAGCDPSPGKPVELSGLRVAEQRLLGFLEGLT